MAMQHAYDGMRAHPRRRVFKRAKLIVSDSKSVIDGMIRDISEGGARVSCSQAAFLPGQFVLVMVTERVMRDVRVVWRSMDEVGVAFQTPPRKALRLLL